MAKDLIQVNGEDLIVREDIAKSFRGVHWAVWSIGAFVIVAGTLFLIFFLGAAADGKLESPSQLQNSPAK